jgi:retron-type reverse transcriptase
MKRTNFLHEAIADLDNLRLAFWKAQRGKSTKPEVNRYRMELDKNLMKLHREILQGNVKVGNYRYFKIFDPKERLICASAFHERVLHHALMNVCHDTFERYQIFDSYACRIEKGTFAALDRAKHYHRKYRWYLKLDVRKYFDSIDHEILKDRLQHRFKEEKLLSIFGKIIDSYSAATGKGLPIGNLTSQYFANHYLAFSDRYLKEILRVPAYVRYMDDIALWANNKEQLLATGKNLENFIANQLKLELKPFCLNATAKGMPFLGYLLFPDYTRLNSDSRKRFSKKMESYTNKLNNGYWSQEEYQRHILPLLSFVRYADTHKLRQQIINRVTIEEVLTV